MQFTALLSFLMLGIIPTCKQSLVAAEPTIYIRLYDKYGWKGKYLQKKFEYGDCVSWAPVVGTYVVSAATQLSGFKCYVWGNNEHCHGDAPYFFSSTYDCQGAGLPTFWRSFSCNTFDRKTDAASGANATSIVDFDAASIDGRAVEDEGDVKDDSEPLVGRNSRDELSKGQEDNHNSTGEKWNCQAGVAGVPYNHCVSNASPGFIRSTVLGFAMSASIAFLVWYE